MGITKTKSDNKNNRYFEAVGRRKTAVARVRIISQTAGDTPHFLVNHRLCEQYFPLIKYQQMVYAPLKLTSFDNKMQVTAIVRGGGTNAQAEAVRHGIARALIKIDENLIKKLGRAGYLTRDPRMVERKKFGLHKARRAHQWKKR